MAKSKVIQKLYSIRVDNEAAGKYSTDVSSFNVVAEDLSEALKSATSKLKSDTNVIGKVEMLHVIS